MGIYLSVFWSICILIICLYILRSKLKVNQNAFMLLTLLAIPFLIVAIIVNDPLFQGIGIPKEYEWVGGLIISGFLLWQFYLNPLKERVIKLENTVASGFALVTTTLDFIKKDIAQINNELKDMRAKFS